MKTKRANTKTIIASTFGWDISEVDAYRYQSTRTKQAIYSVGDLYLAVGKDKPVDFGPHWVAYGDQWFAQKAGTVLWVLQAKLRTV